MTSGDWIIAYLGTAAIIIFILFVLVARIAYKDGWNDRGLHERNRRNTRALSAPSRLIEQPRRAYAGQHAPWEPRMTVTRSATIAFAGGPATVPINSRTDSGELRALIASADRYIEQLHRGEAAYRQSMVTR